MFPIIGPENDKLTVRMKLRLFSCSRDRYITLLSCGRSRLLQRCGRVFAFRSCGPGSIPTSGGWHFSAPCDIWWLSVGLQLVFRVSRWNVPELQHSSEQTRGQINLKQGICSRDRYKTLLLPSDRSRLLQRCGRVFAFRTT